MFTQNGKHNKADIGSSKIRQYEMNLHTFFYYTVHIFFQK